MLSHPSPADRVVLLSPDYKGGDRLRVRVLQEFYDRTADLVLRKAGEDIEVPKERAEYLITHGFATWIREPVKVKPEEV